MTTVVTFVRRARTLLWTALSISIIFCAVIVGLGKLFLPYTAQYQGQLESWLSGEFGRPVEVESFSGEWKAFGPQLALKGLMLQATDGGTGTSVIEEAVIDINARAEKEHFRIKRFAVLYKLLDMDDGELTKTGKIRRKFVMEKYRDLYDALYDESVDKKQVEAFFQYQDGQSTTVEAEMKFYTMEGI